MMSSPLLTRTPPTAKEIMTTRLVTVRPETNVSQAIHLLLKHGVSGMPVVDADGKYLGVFSEKCCMKVLTETAKFVTRPGMKIPLREGLHDEETSAARSRAGRLRRHRSAA